MAGFVPQRLGSELPDRQPADWLWVSHQWWRWACACGGRSFPRWGLGGGRGDAVKARLELGGALGHPPPFLTHSPFLPRSSPRSSRFSNFVVLNSPRSHLEKLTRVRCSDEYAAFSFFFATTSSDPHRISVKRWTWRAAAHGVANSRRRLSDWTELKILLVLQRDFSNLSYTPRVMLPTYQARSWGAGPELDFRSCLSLSFLLVRRRNSWVEVLVGAPGGEAEWTGENWAGRIVWGERYPLVGTLLPYWPVCPKQKLEWLAVCAFQFSMKHLN